MGQNTVFLIYRFNNCIYKNIRIYEIEIQGRNNEDYQ